MNSPLAPRLYGVAGPGMGGFEGKRYTKEEAEAVVSQARAATHRKLISLLKKYGSLTPGE